jgi:hypothetical protein
MLTPPSEVMLSYLTGLAPVGTLFEPKLSQLMADLGYRQKVSIYRCLNELIRSNCVRKIACGANGTIGVLVVTRRLEELDERHRAKWEIDGFGATRDDDCTDEDAPHCRSRLANRVTREDWYARLAEIPDDTRDLTARVCGDPIPDDRRRRRNEGAVRRRVSVREVAGAVRVDDQRKEIA